jgi:hypothetical protein
MTGNWQSDISINPVQNCHPFPIEKDWPDSPSQAEAAHSKPPTAKTASGSFDGSLLMRTEVLTRNLPKIWV